MENNLKNITDIIDLYTKYGESDYIGESITQTEHAIQCAELAIHDSRLDRYDEYIRNCVIVAALLHDIGHLIGIQDNDMQMCNCNTDNKFGNASLGIVGHEGIGSIYLKQCGMPSLVCELVDSHVAAKRYLCTVRTDYYEKLSDASKETMRMQGGMMNNEQIKDFKSSFMPELKIFIREYDDEAKKIGLDLSKSKTISFYNNYLQKALIHGGLFV